jgi:L-threonylcarbamoyladenylate synthase
MARPLHRYSIGAIVLHWLIAFLLLLNIYQGLAMHTAAGLAKFTLFQNHKSVGITILILSLARLGWRLANPPPPYASPLSPLEIAASRATHWGFYVIMIGMPLTGWLAVSASPLGLPTLLYRNGVFPGVPWPHLPGVSHLPLAQKTAVEHGAEAVHARFAVAAGVLLALHVVGALKHQLFNLGPVMHRMLPFGAAPYRAAPVSDAAVAAAAQALRAGGLVLMPTETVYGLAADAANPAAVAALFEAKGRPRFNPLIAHVTGLEAAQRFAAFDERAVKLAEAFWPGPLTIVAPIRDQAAVCDLARAGLATVAVRAPSHPAAQALLKAFGGPVCAPSANRSGRPSPTTFEDAVEETGFAVQASLDGGPCTVGVESTVVAVLPDGPVRLLRPGGLAREAIEALVGPLAEAEDDAKRSPGRLVRHYAPDAPLRLNAAAPESGEAWLSFGDGFHGPLSLSPSGDVREAAQRLFSCLRAADKLKPRGIAVAVIPETGLGEAVNDRLRRAAGFVG